VLADPGQLEQIVVNLAVNARDAVTDGGRITIRTFATMLDAPSTGTHLEAEAGAYAVIEVEDPGSGMSDEVKARIFEPFFTTKEVGRGTGLGLATVYGIVKQLEGGINVSSRPGGGTTFTIYLPLIDADAALAALAPAQASRGEGSGTVLLVEDEPAVRMLVATVLEQDGFRVIAAENRAEALVKIEENTQPLRLVITDVVMPGGSGPELIRLLSLTHPHLKTLFMSGYAPTVFGQNGHDPDQHFLQKPFTGRDLLNRVRQLLGE
jgi:CheY-like chemotaxis protein